MKASRSALVLSALAAAVVWSCGHEAPLTSAPHSPAPRADLVDSLAASASLLTCAPEPYDSVAVTIGPAGGVLAVGLDTLVVPPGALAAPTVITGVTPSDTVDLVQFQPTGLQFMQPASLTMGYTNCNLLGVTLPKQVAYVNSSLQILNLLPSADALQGTVTAQLQHFSGYAVAW